MQTAQTSCFLASVISEFPPLFDFMRNNGFDSLDDYFVSLHIRNASFSHYNKKSNRNLSQAKMEWGTILLKRAKFTLSS